uniref:Uncharacterized protein n=1 Tax=Candidatus Kentrum sp. LFY TaxID=2126342 RepID=A0A450WK09_9GAMM|nr:MAG: hypothetical protein BECKLFY1418C_GA0070996_103119 [Candidatus Kentron sp. LFY]
MSIVANSAGLYSIDSGVIGAPIAHPIDSPIITVSLAWSWWPLEATFEQKNRFQILGDQQGVHRSELDKGIGVEGILLGTSAPCLARSVPRAAR